METSFLHCVDVIVFSVRSVRTSLVVSRGKGIYSYLLRLRLRRPRLETFQICQLFDQIRSTELETLNHLNKLPS